MAKTVRIETMRMSPSEAEDQLLVIQQAREELKRLLARRGGVPFPSSGDELNHMRDERSESQ